MMKAGSAPTACTSTSTAAPRTRSAGGVQSTDGGAPRSTSGTRTSPGVPGTHAIEPIVIGRSTGDRIRPDAGPRVQRDAIGYSSKCAFS